MLQMLNKIRHTGRITLLLIMVSAVIIAVTGFGINVSSGKIKVLRKYLENAETVQPNFEKSIVLYTTKTEKVFSRLMQMRPSSEEEYVNFIANIEAIGKQLSLNVGIKSENDDKEVKNNKAVNGDKTGKDNEVKKDNAAANTITYVISFYGTGEDLKSFVAALQDLPYFIRISEVTYRNLDNLSDAEKKEMNISLKIELFIK